MDEPGQLARIAEILGDYGINIEYLYGFPFRKRNNELINLAFIYTLELDRAREALEKENERNTTLGSSVHILYKEDLQEIGFFTDNSKQ